MTRISVPRSDLPLSYFAYGANLDREEMSHRCPNSCPLVPARLNGYSLQIALPIHCPSGPGWATVVPKEGDWVPGALYSLHKSDLDALDTYEDYPELYMRDNVKVETERGVQIAMIYRMREPLRMVSPTHKYVTTLRKGYRDFNLPEECLETALQRSGFETR